ncbi:Hsp20/alpha crystallin family protein [Fervidicoccus sp.]|uniref:Hsp20/alpha crystallin family protein n=1 Tax=Fervidicoccus sp. TaxID=2060324 RepID=UPI003CAAA65B
MYWYDDFERIREYIRKRIKEMEREFEDAFLSTSLPIEEFTAEDISSPLYTIYESEDSYYVVIDAPYMDTSSLTIEAHDNILNIEVKLKEKINLGNIGYRLHSCEIFNYRKTISLPPDADVSRLTYSIKSGRIIINIPKKHEK